MLIVRSISIFSFKRTVMRYIILHFLLFANFHLSAQNLLSNGNFESLVRTDNNYDFLVVKDWHLSSLCYNCNDNNTNFYNTPMGKDRRCDPKYYKYLEGRTKIWFLAVMFKGMEGSGGSFIYTKLKQKLKVGKIYKAEVNFYFPSIQLIDSTLYRYIGFNILKTKPEVPESFKNWKFVNDTIVYDQWFKRTWYFRALCELEYFVLGATYINKNSDYDVKKSKYSEYYMDNVSLEEVEEKNLDSMKINATPFCRCKDANQPYNQPINEQSVYYETNKFDISEESKLRLDSLVLYLKKYPNSVFEVSGYTDEVGTNHEELSKNRVDAVIKYLIENHKISKYRLLTNYVGNIEKSKDENIRQKNRRVDLKLSKYRIDQIFYKKALNSLNSDSAFIYLKLWLLAVNPEHKIYALFDTRLDVLKKNKKWDLVVKDIKSMYNKYKNPKEAFMLDSMYQEDQKYRTLEIGIEELAEMYESRKEDIFAFPKITNEEWKQLDTLNYLFMSQYIDKNGWPNQSEVGDRPSRAAFYIIDHNLDTNSLKKYVPIIEKKCIEGEADWKDYATIFDRKEKECGRLQQYCTQYMKDPEMPNRYIFASYDSEAAVNERRKKIGLQPIRDFNISFTMKITHLKNGGKL